MCEKCEKQRKLFDDFAATHGGPAGDEYLRALDDEDMEVLHDALHEQMAGIVIDRAMQGPDAVVQRAGALTQMHTMVKRIETEREQGYDYTDEQHAEAKEHAKYFLAKMLGLPMEHIEVIEVDEEGKTPPGYSGTNIKMYKSSDPNGRADFERDLAIARGETPPEPKETAITPHAIAKVIEQIIRDTAVPSKDIPLA